MTGVDLYAGYGGFLIGLVVGGVIVGLCRHLPSGRYRRVDEEPSEFAAYWMRQPPLLASILAFVKATTPPVRGAVIGEVLRQHPATDRRYVEGMYDALAAQGLVPAAVDCFPAEDHSTVIRTNTPRAGETQARRDRR